MKIMTQIITVLWVVLSCSQSREVNQLESFVLFTETGDDWYEAGNANWEFSNNELIGSLYSGAGFVITKTTSYDT